MVNLSVLDLFILSCLSRGLESPYDLQREAGVSLGASLPALRRLLQMKLVEKSEAMTARNRPRHQYQLTPSGRKEALGGWKRCLSPEAELPGDIDSILRVVDMAVHHEASQSAIQVFLQRASDRRRDLAEQVELKIAQSAGRPAVRLAYPALRLHYDANRLRAEAETLKALAGMVGPAGKAGPPKPKNPPKRSRKLSHKA